MLGRKYWAESPLSELSSQKELGEGSDSFRIGRFWLLWGALFSPPLSLFLAVWIWPFLFFSGFLFLFSVHFLVVFCVNHMDSVSAKRELFGGSFEIL
jgi:hypothetical protein